MNNTLIVYYSWSESTHEVAKKISQNTGGTLFELVMKQAYSKDYNTVVKQAKQEISQGFQPDLLSDIDINAYDTIFIGSPNWWGTIAPPVLSFINKHDFNGKCVIPFCTHGGGGEQRVLKDIVSACKIEYTANGLCLSGSHVASANEQIKNWLKNLEN